MGWVSKTFYMIFCTCQLKDVEYIFASAIYSFDDVTIIKIFYVCVN